MCSLLLTVCSCNWYPSWMMMKIMITQCVITVLLLMVSTYIIAYSNMTSSNLIVKLGTCWHVPGFLKLLLFMTSVHMCVCVCVSTPKGFNNQWCDIDPVCLVLPYTRELQQ